MAGAGGRKNKMNMSAGFRLGQKRSVLTGPPRKKRQSLLAAGLSMAVFSFAAAAYAPFLPADLKEDGQKAALLNEPDLSGEWVFPCQNLGTDGLVFSRVLLAAYIGSQAVFSHVDFEGPGCKCENFLEEYKELWRFELLGEMRVFSGIYEIDYYRQQFGAFDSAAPSFPSLFDILWPALVKKDGKKLYFSPPAQDPSIRPQQLDREPYLFSRHLTETAENYMAKEACPLKAPFAEDPAL